LGIRQNLAKVYNPDQPRVPAGSGRTSGEWTSGGSGSVGADQPRVIPAGDDPAQVQINRAVHDAEVEKEILQWKAIGMTVTRQVSFLSAKTGTRVTVDYVVSMMVPDPNTFFLTTTLEPILARDVKTGRGGYTDNQSEMYPYIFAGGPVIPVGLNAERAGFRVGEPTRLNELSVGGGPYDFTRH